jgi:glucose dehydrogenase
MDNALTPVLADVVIGGQTKKVIFYASKSAFQFTLDRTNGKPVLPIEYRAVPGDSRNNPAPTQPWPLQSQYNPLCVVKQNLGSEVPGDQNRVAPNWNGFQAEPDPAHPGNSGSSTRRPTTCPPKNRSWWGRLATAACTTGRTKASCTCSRPARTAATT